MLHFCALSIALLMANSLQFTAEINFKVGKSREPNISHSRILNIWLSSPPLQYNQNNLIIRFTCTISGTVLFFAVFCTSTRPSTFVLVTFNPTYGYIKLSLRPKYRIYSNITSIIHLPPTNSLSGLNSTIYLLL